MTSLPQWMTWVQALGPTTAAIAALIIASAIQYRQWVTARDKLALDLLDRRYALYQEILEIVYFGPLAQSPEEKRKQRDIVVRTEILFGVAVAKLVQEAFSFPYKSEEAIRETIVMKRVVDTILAETKMPLRRSRR